MPKDASSPKPARATRSVMRNSAVQAIGKDNLLALNNLGNRMVDGGSPMLGSNINIVGDQGDKVVNVFVVSPDQRPQMTENDVVVVMNEQLANRKSTYKLIKSIQMGQL